MRLCLEGLFGSFLSSLIKWIWTRFPFDTLIGGEVPAASTATEEWTIPVGNQSIQGS